MLVWPSGPCVSRSILQTAELTESRGGLVCPSSQLTFSRHNQLSRKYVLRQVLM